MPTQRETRRSFRGIVPPLVTPLLQPDQLDVAGLERLLTRILTAPVAGVFVLGTTGEGPNLSHRLRRELIERSVKFVAGRVPVLVGITDTSMADSAALADYAADRGADAVVVAPPYYHKPTPVELRRWLATLAPRVPLPLYPYNMPAHTRTVFDVDTLKLAMDLPNCPGFKDSGGDITYFESVLRLRDQHRPDWRVFIGPEHLTRKATALGGDGGVNGGANVFPKLFTDLFTAADAKDDATADRLQQTVETFGGIYRLGEGESSVIRGLKAALSVVGICTECSAEPWEPLNAEAMAEVKRILECVNNN
ncbi:MAG: dihydrodipicolinate synthase family protein [Gemmataceae bacterium]